ncbi:uncharacterized protein [Cherax quadricarinatus]|uniref:uncharacterized protein isoform X1 n=2 Tax=Cherax quadricarinatus TaxID=27406 RepID=UPI002379825A|nr:uncharacterized protein LOC128697575 isoform X1 [Cherax quadricarinatus]
MSSTLDATTGMAWLVMVTVLAIMVNHAHSDAGHFFAATPKVLPRIGRRGDLPPLTTLLTEAAQSSGKAGQSITEALGQLDTDRDGCIGIEELLRIPILKVAILLQNPALLLPQAEADTEARETYTTDLRPEPRLLRFLQN